MRLLHTVIVLVLMGLAPLANAVDCLLMHPAATPTCHATAHPTPTTSANISMNMGDCLERAALTANDTQPTFVTLTIPAPTWATLTPTTLPPARFSYLTTGPPLIPRAMSFHAMLARTGRLLT